jgi:hypothetical protein
MRKITRKQRAEAMKALGLDTKDVVSTTMGVHEITVTRVSRNAWGRRFLDPSGNIATHVETIPVA